MELGCRKARNSENPIRRDPIEILDCYMAKSTKPFRHEKANSIVQAIEIALKLRTEFGDDYYPWFRGISNRKHDLRPGAYWRLKYDEVNVLVHFSQEAVTYAKVDGINSWETYYLAQHHRVPTRLLDWTESFGAALFFAFDKPLSETKDFLPCIWVLQPELFNELFVKWKGVLTPDNNPLEGWLPKRIAKDKNIVAQDHEGYVFDNEFPLAIYPRKTNNRIVAQHGMFTVHGRNKECLLTQCGKKSADLFTRIDLDIKDRKSVHESLRSLGIKRKSIFPDIDNFVEGLKEELPW